VIVANVLQPLIDVADVVLNFFHDDVGLGWGASIVGLTFVTRLAILPLSIKQIRSMRALQAFQPQIQEIREKYKDDRERQQREMMKLYQDNKINPFASCVPLVLQIPVFLALFYLLRSDDFVAEVKAAPPEGWLFIPDLTEEATGGVLITLIIVPFIISFPSGLVLYWISTNVWTLGQQFLVKRIAPPPEKPTPEEVKATKPPPPPPRKRKRRR
jgi:YidC/Oxa1 family membrane protein insertase